MKRVHVEGFEVFGPSVRTNNAREAGGAGKIPSLWADFHASGRAREGAAYGVYSDYESDASGDFTVTAGTKKNSGDAPGLSISPGGYLAFPANGPMPGAVIEAWKRVWEYFSAEGIHTRSYDTDFEEYSGPESATIYIGIRDAR